MSDKWESRPSGPLGTWTNNKLLEKSAACCDTRKQGQHQAEAAVSRSRQTDLPVFKGDLPDQRHALVLSPGVDQVEVTEWAEVDHVRDALACGLVHNVVPAQALGLRHGTAGRTEVQNVFLKSAFWSWLLLGKAAYFSLQGLVIKKIKKQLFHVSSPHLSNHNIIPNATFTDDSMWNVLIILQYV